MMFVTGQFNVVLEILYSEKRAGHAPRLPPALAVVQPWMERRCAVELRPFRGQPG